MTFTLNPLSDALGAEITGIDLAGTVDDATFGRINHAYHAHQIIVFRDQDLSPERQIAFSRRFGDLEIHISAEFLHHDHPEILLVSNRRVDGNISA